MCMLSCVGLGPVHVHGSRTKTEQREVHRSSEGQHQFTWEKQKCLAHWHMHQSSSSDQKNLFQLFVKQKDEEV